MNITMQSPVSIARPRRNLSAGTVAYGAWRVALGLALAVAALAVLPAAVGLSPVLLMANHVRKVRARNQSWSLQHSTRRGRAW